MLTQPEMMSFIKDHFWWHSIELGNGVVTPGRKDLDLMRREFRAVFDGLKIEGRTVLDVGAWDGGFSVEAARRGAKSVTALDHYTWTHQSFRGRETFDFVAKATGFDFDAVDIDLDSPRLDLSSLGMFDVVLYLGVFYHLKDPIAALREVSALVRDVLVVETHIERLKEERPAMVFFPGAELGNDPTNWWGPNKSLMLALLKDLGFSKISVRDGSVPSRQVFHASR